MKSFDEISSPQQLSRSLAVKSRWFIGLVILLLSLIVIVLLTSRTAYSDVLIYDSKYSIGINSLGENKNDKFVSLNLDNLQLSLTDELRQHGGAFEVSKVGGGCFRIKASNRHWLKLDDVSGFIVASEREELFGTSFAAVKESTFVSKRCSKQSDCFDVKLRLCSQNAWVSLLEVAPGSVSLYSRPESNSWWSRVFKSTADESSETWPSLVPQIFSLERIQQVKGVNLGGWFIPEVWMSRSFYSGTGLGWGGSLCAIVRYDRELAEERIGRLLESWITEDDIAEIANMGFNSVRLPIGYWNIIQDPYGMFAPASVKTSLKYIDWCFDVCQKYGLTVLLDLHGAPGNYSLISSKLKILRREFRISKW